MEKQFHKTLVIKLARETNYINIIRAVPAKLERNLKWMLCSIINKLLKCMRLYIFRAIFLLSIKLQFYDIVYNEIKL